VVYIYCHNHGASSSALLLAGTVKVSLATSLMPFTELFDGGPVNIDHSI
jgi:hypothetical protein